MPLNVFRIAGRLTHAVADDAPRPDLWATSANIWGNSGFLAFSEYPHSAAQDGAAQRALPPLNTAAPVSHMHR